jgi:hypothetical protein
MPRSAWERLGEDEVESERVERGLALLQEAFEEVSATRLSLQDQIDERCERYTMRYTGQMPTGRLLSDIAQVLTEDFGVPIVVVLVPCDTRGGLKIAGYPLPLPPRLKSP